MRNISGSSWNSMWKACFLGEEARLMRKRPTSMGFWEKTRGDFPQELSVDIGKLEGLRRQGYSKFPEIPSDPYWSRGAEPQHVTAKSTMDVSTENRGCDMIKTPNFLGISWVKTKTSKLDETLLFIISSLHTHVTYIHNSSICRGFSLSRENMRKCESSGNWRRSMTLIFRGVRTTSASTCHDLLTLGEMHGRAPVISVGIYRCCTYKYV